MRLIHATLDSMAIGQTQRLAPAFKIEVYDLRSSVANTINDIVSGFTLEAIVGPKDFTNNAISVSVTEAAGDYATGGIASSIATLLLQDPNGFLDPFGVIADPTVDARFFRAGNVIRIFEGDESVADTDWPNTFTLEIQGQVGYDRSRAVGPNGISQLQVRAVSREASFLGFTRITREYTLGEAYIAIGTDIARNEMGLNPEELNLSGWGSTRSLRHTTMTLADESPIVMLARVMFVDGFLPRFQGDGKLAAQSALLNNTLSRIYENKDTISLIGWPLASVQAADTVTVVGLDFQLVRVNHPLQQTLAKANVTTGYFTQDEEIEVLFSDDKSVLAENPSLIIIRSVNGGFTSLGGGESFVGIPAPNPQQEGFIGITITISTGYAPWLATFLIALYIGLSAVPNLVIVIGFIASSGFTINVGSIAAAVALSAALIIMTAIGRGTYEVIGDPFEYAFPEIRETAQVEGVSEFSENELIVNNHLVDDAETAEFLARELLFLQQATLHPRNVKLIQDLALEPGDSFSTEDDNRFYYIKEISRTLIRTGSTIEETLTCYETTPSIVLAG